MTRPLKQFLYGTLYVAIILGIGFLLFKSSPASLPTCTDGVQNQGEIEIDCGGPYCTSCAVAKVRPLYLENHVQAFHSSAGETVLFAEVVNPNETLGVQEFSYRFLVYNFYGDLIESIPGTNSIGPSERRYLFAPNVSHNFDSIERVTLSIDAVEESKWILGEYFAHPTVVLTRQRFVIDESGKMFIEGAIRNESSIYASEVTIIALVFDERGSELIGSQTLVRDLKSFSEKPFTVVFPYDETYVSRVDKDSVKIFLNTQ